MTDTLRERVARALCTDDGNPCGCVTACKVALHYADLAIPLIRNEALEQAARVASGMYRKGQIGPDIAAAIRALKDKP